MQAQSIAQAGDGRRSGRPGFFGPRNSSVAPRTRGVAYGFRLRLVSFVLLFISPRQLIAATHYADQLSRECDDLIALAIKRPYGWAWAEERPQPKSKSAPQPANFDPPGTAAAAFVLYWSGDFLDHPAYKEAAYNAARGMAAAQQSTGQIPANPVFSPTAAGGHDPSLLIPNRAASRAALALYLSLLDDTGGKDETLRRYIAAPLNWLLKQQGASGAWPQGHPPTTAPKDAAKIIRLDTPDYRESVFAMLLASDVLGDTRTRLSVEHSIQLLLRMRIGGASRLGDSLWATAYGLDGYVSQRLPDYPPGVDLLASRHAMQILLAAYVMLDDPPTHEGDKVSWSRPLIDAAMAVGKLPKYEGKWLRRYDFDVSATPAPPSTQPSGFETKPPFIPPTQRTDTWGLTTLTEDAQNLIDSGRDRFKTALATNFTIRQRLAAAVCGLDDDPFSVELPVRDEDIAPFLKDHAEKFSSLDEPPPSSLSERVRRIYLLLIRAKLERRPQK